MPNLRQTRLRIRSVKNIAQVTRALQAFSASKVRKAMQAMHNTQLQVQAIVESINRDRDRRVDG